MSLHDRGGAAGTSGLQGDARPPREDQARRVTGLWWGFRPVFWGDTGRGRSGAGRGPAPRAAVQHYALHRLVGLVQGLLAIQMQVWQPVRPLDDCLLMLLLLLLMLLLLMPVDR